MRPERREPGIEPFNGGLDGGQVNGKVAQVVKRIGAFLAGGQQVFEQVNLAAGNRRFCRIDAQSFDPFGQG